MTKKQQKISVYSYDCKAFVDEIKLLSNTLENQNLSDVDVRAINCKICQDINNEITACMKLPKVKDYDDYEIINRGATSLCYQSIDDAQQKTILKVFEPESFPLSLITPYSDIEHGVVVSYKWIDCNRTDSTQELAFLKRFVRFILQEELITTLKKNANKEKRNLFIVPQLTLTTKGFAFISPYFFGDTLKERFQKYAETTTSTMEEKICDSVMAVRQAAEYIRDVCHGKNNIYHGDIKPSNFFDIKDGDSHLIKNIDFDTLVDFNENSFCGYRNWDVAATTPLFYYADTARITRNQDFDKIKEYDISALSRMLMYAIICIYGQEENLYNAFNSDSNHFNWIDFFFEGSDVGERLFNDICIAGSTREGDYSERIELSGLFIFEKIRSLLVRCSEKVKDIVGIQEFIDCLLLIEELFKHNKNDFSMPSDTGREQGYILNEVIRHLNLLYLDNENIRNNKKIVVDYHKLIIDLRTSINWVQYVIEQNYYCTSENEAARAADSMAVYIDRHLIPDILFEGVGEKPLAYDFKNNKLPLEQALSMVGNKSLFLTAEGGQGKTTTLRSFWLDFLSGKHDKPCLYVDAKMLSANDGVEAIQEYVSYNKKGYSFSLLDAKIKLLLLIDGANESNVNLRKEQENGSCSLVSECKDLIEKECIQIIIGSRSKVITTIRQKDEKRMNGVNKNDEFGDNIRYATVCKLNDTQVKHCMGKDFADVKDKQPLIDLLRNNMMLHIFTNLKSFGIELEQKDMRAGKLLDMYFNVCFRTRYVKSIISEDLSLRFSDDKQLYSTIENIRKNGINDADERLIRDAFEYYDTISDFLIANCMNDVIDLNDLNNGISIGGNKVFLSDFENLSIIVKNSKEHYIWANEVYLEYFMAKKIEADLKKIYESNDNIDIDNIEEDVLFDDIEISLSFPSGLWILSPFERYNVFQFVGDFFDGNRGFFAKILDKTYCLEEIILRISLLSNGDIPIKIKIIDDVAFVGCKNIYKISISHKVESIGERAFYSCENLRTVSIRFGINDIGAYAFASCAKLETIASESVKNIGDGAFKDCSQLSQIEPLNELTRIGAFAFKNCCNLHSILLPDSVNYIGQGAFDNCKELTVKMSRQLYNQLKNSKNTNYRGDKCCVVDLDSLNIELLD